MSSDEAKKLIEKGVRNTGNPQLWADLGCGNGLFAIALAELLPQGSHITAIDKIPQIIHSTGRSSISFLKSDFENDELNINDLSGIMMANSLHYIADKQKLLRKLEKHLNPGGKFLIIEYDTARANHWVPYPIMYDQLYDLFANFGFNKIQKLATRRSIYRKDLMYAALIEKCK